MTFYDDHPFQFVDSDSADKTYPPLFRKLLEGMQPRTRSVDLGCGPGRNLKGLSDRGKTFGFDRSIRSTFIASAWGGVACADVVRLAIRSEAVDVAVLDGVAHHTPDPQACLSEASRILRPDGLLYFAVYKDTGYYPIVYKGIGGPLRWMYRRPWGARAGDVSAVPVYGLLHRLRRGRRSEDAIRNLFADYFLTPIASFHSREEVESWAVQCGLRLEEYDPFPSGNCHLFLFRKAAVEREDA